MQVGGPAEFAGLTLFATSSEFLADVRIEGEVTVGTVSTSSSLTVYGEASVSGELKASRITAEKIESPGLTLLADALGALSTTTEDLASRIETLEAARALELTELLELEGGLAVSGLTILKGGLQVSSIGALESAIYFASDTIFFGRPYFNSDTGGFAEIRQGARKVEVVFEREYLEPPIVNATISVDKIEGGSETIEELIFAGDIRYLVINKSTKGFAIILNKPAPINIGFSWIALAIKDAKVFSSQNNTEPTPNYTDLTPTNETIPPSPTATVEQGATDTTATTTITSESVDTSTPTEPNPELNSTPIESTVESLPEPAPEPTSEPIAEPVPESTPKPTPEPAPAPAPEPTP